MLTKYNIKLSGDLLQYLSMKEILMTRTGYTKLTLTYKSDTIHIYLHILEVAMKRTNIMLTDEQHRKLKSYSKKEGKTLGELVREAVDNAYKKKDVLDHRKAVAIDAYKEGLISLGKLSEILGVDVISARIYLKEQGITLGGQDKYEIVTDAANA